MRTFAEETAETVIVTVGGHLTRVPLRPGTVKVFQKNQDGYLIQALPEGGFRFLVMEFQEHDIPSTPIYDTPRQAAAAAYDHWYWFAAEKKSHSAMAEMKAYADSEDPFLPHELNALLTRELGAEISEDRLAELTRNLMLMANNPISQL